MGNVIPCGGSPRRDSGSGTVPGGRSSFMSRGRGPNHGRPINITTQPLHQQDELTVKGKEETVGQTGQSNEFVYLRQLRIRHPKIRVLVALEKNSRVYETVRSVLDDLGIESVDGCTTDSALVAWNVRRESSGTSGVTKEYIVPNLVIVDTRNRQVIDHDILTRSVRHSVHGQHVVLVGVMKKSMMDREEVVVENLLQMGFNRVVGDSYSRGFWMNEIYMMIHSELNSCLKLQCADTLFTALENCKDIIQITDNQDRFLYGNSSFEKIMGFSQADLLDTNLWELQSPVGLSELVLAENEEYESSASTRDNELVRQRLDHGKSWEGTLLCKKRSGEQVNLETRAIPVSLSLSSKRSPDHIVYLKQLPNVVRDEDVGSRRRGSRQTRQAFDPPGQNFETVSLSSTIGTLTGPNQIANTISNRRSSSAVLASSGQAPINKVVSLLIAAQEKSSPEIAVSLDKVIEILQTCGDSDLFSPEIEKDKNKKSDPVVNDLLGALLSQGTTKPLSRSSSVIHRQTSMARAKSNNHRRINSSREIFHGRRGSADMASSYGRTYGYHGHHGSHLSSAPPTESKENSVSVSFSTAGDAEQPVHGTEIATSKGLEMKPLLPHRQAEYIKDFEPEDAIIESVATDQVTLVTSEYIYESDIELLSMDSGGTDECSDTCIALKTVGVPVATSGAIPKLSALMTVDEKSLEEASDDVTLIVPSRPKHEPIIGSEFPLDLKDPRLMDEKEFQSISEKAHELPALPDCSPAPLCTMTAEIRTALENNNSWNFDILTLERITDFRCLTWVGMSILLRFNVPKILKCSEVVLQNWLSLIEANYMRENTYHNSTHAADVLHATAYFLDQETTRNYVDELDETICLVSAVIHDVDHPGKNSAFLCNSGSALAQLYNDMTVLENHHASFGFRLSLADDRVNIFKNLDCETFRVVRQGIIDLVLATDMSKHFFHLNRFINRFSMIEDRIYCSNPGTPYRETEEQRSETVAILKRMIIKCADVSNPARPFPHSKVWAYRIAEEYFSQTDEEKKLGLPIVMPQFDRQTCSIPRSQIGFYDFFINEMFSVWSDFLNREELYEWTQHNYSFWQDEVERQEGITLDKSNPKKRLYVTKKKREEQAKTEDDAANEKKVAVKKVLKVPHFPGDGILGNRVVIIAPGMVTTGILPLAAQRALSRSSPVVCGPIVEQHPESIIAAKARDMLKEMSNYELRLKPNSNEVVVANAKPVSRFHFKRGSSKGEEEIRQGSSEAPGTAKSFVKSSVGISKLMGSKSKKKSKSSKP